MKTLKPGLLVVIGVLLAVGAGCGDDHGDKLSKEEAARLAKADNLRDFCAEFNWYDDGECDDFCLTPDPDCGGCFAEGQAFEDVRTDGKCCTGLKPVPDNKWLEAIGECVHPRCPCFVCTACGDGVCGTGENKCNCPEDCERECLGEGEHFEDFRTEGKCCGGLQPVPDYVYSQEMTQCIGSRCPCYVCTACGDGACGAGENACNCPKDCAEYCGGIAGLMCTDNKVCIDDPSDSCNPDSGGADCMGICVTGQDGGLCQASLHPDHAFYQRYEAPDADNACNVDEDCMESGCSGEVCAVEAIVTTCEAIPLPDGSCGCLGGQCQWMTCDE